MFVVADIRELDLKSLSSVSGLSNAWATFLCEAASFCLEKHGHANGTKLIVDGDSRMFLSLLWCRSSPGSWSSWSDLGQATEFGAYGIAILLVINLTEYKAIERAVKGTGIDYWLGTDSLLFQQKARLEVSGIFKGSEAKVDERARQKAVQTGQSDKTRMPVYIVIVEFGTPRSKIIKK